MRGGLDDALDKLARRDELRRRAAGEATGTPPAVTELVEAIAAVIGRNPKMEVTVGVEGVSEPVLLHFAMEDGVVQVSADNTVADRVAEPETPPRHADFDLDAEEAYAPATPSSYGTPVDNQQDTHRISYDDRDRYDPGTGYSSTPEYATQARSDAFFTDPPPGDRGYDRFEDFNQPPLPPPPEPHSFTTTPPPEPHPFAATPPPPVPPVTTRRIRVEQHRATEEPSAAERASQQRQQQQQPDPQPAARGMPEPLPEPIPLRIDSEETEVAAKRLAALLRDNPTLLRQAPPE
jgi:hypothetical protein